MASPAQLRALGLFEARAPRYTSYPPANHFGTAVTAETVAGWQRDIPAGARISLYLHIPYCRRLCWFCACRTQGTATDRPLTPYLAQLRAELALLAQNLRPDVTLAQIHLGGGTPTLLPAPMLRALGGMLKSFRPWAEDIEFSVEIDPTEVDADRISALRDIGMTRASIGVQDFDPVVQDSIGRQQSFETTRDVVAMLRDAGIRSVNMDILYGLPHQTQERMRDCVRKVISLSPDRIALYGYAHVPWMAKRQALIPAEALPEPDARLDLFDTARRLFLWDGYQEIGIDHYARPNDSLAIAASTGQMHRNFQGYTADDCEVLIGLGASAISRYPQGFAQNAPASSAYATAIEAGRLATTRGHAMSADDHLRGEMIERLMCDFAIDLLDIARTHNLPLATLEEMTAPLRARFADHVRYENHRITLTSAARLIARLAAQEIDAYAMPAGAHSRAM